MANIKLLLRAGPSSGGVTNILLRIMKVTIEKGNYIPKNIISINI